MRVCMYVSKTTKMILFNFSNKSSNTYRLSQNGKPVDEKPSVTIMQKHNFINRSGQKSLQNDVNLIKLYRK